MNAEADSEPTVQELTLHAVRALGIFFIRSAVALLVGGMIVGVGWALLVFGGVQATALGFILVGAGAIVTIVWQIVILISASNELTESGAGGIKKVMDHEF